VEMSYAPISLDAPMGTSLESGLLDMLPTDDENGPDRSLERSQLSEDVSDALLALRPKEAAVLKMYFGLHPEVPHSLEEIGNRLNITRERVRQIKEQALAKMRYGSRHNPLHSHMALA
jgi:RNA polymerase primary sigma factor